MTQRNRCENRIRAAKSEHDEARHYVKNSKRRVRNEYQRVHSRAQRKLGAVITAEDLSDYEYAVGNYEFPYDPEFWDMLDWEVERETDIQPRYWRL